MRRIYSLVILCSLCVMGIAQTKQELADRYEVIIDSLMRAEAFEEVVDYVEMRAELDTCNAIWQYQSGYCMEYLGDSEAAILYYGRALDVLRKLYKESPTEYRNYLLMTLDRVAPLYRDAWMDAECEEAYEEMLGIYRQQAKDNPREYNPSLAGTLSDFAFFYQSIQLYTFTLNNIKMMLFLRFLCFRDRKSDNFS